MVERDDMMHGSKNDFMRQTFSTAEWLLIGNGGQYPSAGLVWWFSCANQLESFFLVPVPRASHWLAMALYGRGDVETDVPAT